MRCQTRVRHAHAHAHIECDCATCHTRTFLAGRRFKRVDAWSFQFVSFFSGGFWVVRQQFENIKKVFTWHVIDLLKCFPRLLNIISISFFFLYICDATRNSIKRVVFLFWVFVVLAASGCLFIYNVGLTWLFKPRFCDMHENCIASWRPILCLPNWPTPQFQLSVCLVLGSQNGSNCV